MTMGCTFLFISLCMCLGFGLTEAVPANSLITKLPGFNATFPSKHYSGYVSIDGNPAKQLFYYFVKSERKPSNDPVVLWLNGGPRCSSFDGFVYEHVTAFLRYINFEILNLSVVTIANATQKSQKVFVHVPSEIAVHDVQKLLFCCLILLLSSVLFLTVAARSPIFKNPGIANAMATKMYEERLKLPQRDPLDDAAMKSIASFDIIQGEQTGEQECGNGEVVEKPTETIQEEFYWAVPEEHERREHQGSKEAARGAIREVVATSSIILFSFTIFMG
ncbi:Serine carboxypeptidase-like 20 [Camellia lanceoleosa]|uniref:Serine carboxypeptidase-like 20 n=1 Tax=Camellia lanceoleosa TaxID=1840588 RepID=A0ACC0H8B1_9ERIC|nr:Serine carboxypeptidase-like 20 [Camellia lanceoleosa]